MIYYINVTLYYIVFDDTILRHTGLNKCDGVTRRRRRKRALAGASVGGELVGSAVLRAWSSVLIHLRCPRSSFEVLGGSAMLSHKGYAAVWWSHVPFRVQHCFLCRHVRRLMIDNSTVPGEAGQGRDGVVPWKLPNDCPPHAPNTYPQRSTRAPQLSEHRLNIGSNVVEELPDEPSIGPTSDELIRPGPQFGQIGPFVCQISTEVDAWSIGPRLLQSLAKFGAKLGAYLANQIWRTRAPTWVESTTLGQLRSRLGPSWPNSAKVCPRKAKLGRIWAVAR